MSIIENLDKGDEVSFQPNPKGGIDGYQPKITGVVLGRTRSQKPGVFNLIVRVQEGFFSKKKSLAGTTKIVWYRSGNNS